MPSSPPSCTRCSILNSKTCRDCLPTSPIPHTIHRASCFTITARVHATCSTALHPEHLALALSSHTNYLFSPSSARSNSHESGAAECRCHGQSVYLAILHQILFDTFHRFELLCFSRLSSSLSYLSISHVSPIHIFSILIYSAHNICSLCLMNETHHTYSRIMNLLYSMAN